MSYDISLVDPVTKKVLQLDTPHQMKGGTYALGGTKEAALNITYNYGGIYQRIFKGKGVRTLYGLSGAQSIPVLQAAIAQLNDDTDPDYWKATEGNAKLALWQLRSLAEMRPDGVWEGD